MRAQALTSSKLSFRRGIEGAALLFAVLCFVSPALFLGQPFVSPDTPAYFKGGDLAVRFVNDHLRPLQLPSGNFVGTRSSTGSGHSGNTAQSGWTRLKGSAAYLIPESAVGIRSAYYGLFARLLGNKTLWLVIFAQALIAIFSIWRFLKTFTRIGSFGFWAICLLLAAITSLPWFVSYVMPDIFSGVLILLLSTLLFDPLTNSRRVKIIDYCLVLFCVIVHTSNLLLSIALLPGVVLIALFGQITPYRATLFRRVCTVAAVILAGVLADILVNYVAFGAVSLTARTPPFLLARSVVDGPGRFYLRDHCASDPQSFHFCRYVDSLPTTVNDFLWDPKGIYMSAHPDERDKIRAEQTSIVINAALAYPWLQFKAALGNVGQNMLHFGLSGVRTDIKWHGAPEFKNTSHEPPEILASIQESSNKIIYGSTIISILIITLIFARLMHSPIFPVLLFMIIGLIGNAAITGILSTASSRYQSRVIWILPLIAIVSIITTSRTSQPHASLKANVTA